MTGTAIDGRAYARLLSERTASYVERLHAQLHLTPGLATILVGDDYGAQAYERRLGKAAERLGVPHTAVRLPADTPESDVLAYVGTVNADPRISGILLLRPVPEAIDERAIYRLIDPLKDIESMHPTNAGLLSQGHPRFVPSTPASVMYLLDHYLHDTGRDADEFLRGRRAVVVGRSTNVGQPISRILLNRGATVIACDIHTSMRGMLEQMTRLAEVLVVAVGVPRLITTEHVAEGAIVIDVGINALTDPETGKNRMVGDVDFDSVIEVAEAVSPVPGGVGPITDICLIRNTVAAAELNSRHREAELQSEWTVLTAPRPGQSV